MVYSHFQQSYQTFYKQSFRVADYVTGEGASLRQLILACEGITVRDGRTSDGRTNAMVVLQASHDSVPRPPSQPVPVPRTRQPQSDMTKLSEEFKRLLKSKPPPHQISLK